MSAGIVQNSKNTNEAPERQNQSEGGLSHAGLALKIFIYIKYRRNTHPLHYVYLLRSLTHPDKTYIGLTEDLNARIKKHNEGGSPHTSKYKPWQLVTYLAFSTRKKASEFEAYLKSGSGRAFAKKRLW